ncbi:FadR family transcriptional regulator [Virgibacillus sp. MSJ-26]|uniref:FadR/GntR family transcriptional regulator n=1 Tax=Virgibacillus sp. MSJ-26 TaxID=2841522 RepID=UPI001C1073E2|nr:FadR/GntR family transcriptional regulator [Virgibacillus sp. MSJ-26]MBU5466094.1 FadR family transcriptional regulator [Virgibacillus sp. MSJ-26]
MLRKTSRVSLVEQVSSQIEKLIESGQWCVGDRLPPEMELMKEFDVSRNTLREAIQALVHAGLLETKQGSGTIVKSKSSLEAALHRQVEKSSVMETLEVRLALEREAAQLAAERRTEEDLTQLEQAIKACKSAAATSNLEDFLKADIQFHQTLVKSAHNQMLYELYDYITDPLVSSIRNLMISDAHFDYEKEIHSELFESIKQQNVQHATEHVNHYIKEFREKITQIQED